MRAWHVSCPEGRGKDGFALVLDDFCFFVSLCDPLLREAVRSSGVRGGGDSRDERMRIAVSGIRMYRLVCDAVG